jgi:hypothetical protein
MKQRNSDAQQMLRRNSKPCNQDAVNANEFIRELNYFASLEQLTIFIRTNELSTYLTYKQSNTLNIIGD